MQLKFLWDLEEITWEYSKWNYFFSARALKLQAKEK